MLKIAIPLSPGKTQLAINEAYVNYVAGSGYDPILVAPDTNIETITVFCDGLLLPGGIDIDPVFYGEDNVMSQGVNPDKDDFERRCFYAFVKAQKPIFGICRGFQLIIREFLRNGLEGSEFLTYWQHINKHRNTAELDILRTIRSHSVIIRPDILYGEKDKVHRTDFVNSIHHQAIIMRVPKKEDLLEPVGMFVPAAVTKIGVPPKTKGFLVEGYSIRGWNNAPIRAVQWHPEELKDYALLKTFFDRFGGKKVKPVIKKVIADVKQPGDKQEVPEVANQNNQG